MKQETKNKITEAALFLFNRFGFVNVRLQHIADEAEISVGNLAYHFKNKESIIEYLYNEILEGQKKLLSDLRFIPLFESFDKHLENTYWLQVKYSFFYTDTLEVMRAFPKIRNKHRSHLKWQSLQIKMFIDFNISRAAFLPIKAPDSSEQMADRFCSLIETWLTYSTMVGKKANKTELKTFKSLVWSMFSSYFSATGDNEFKHLIKSSDL